VTSKTLGHQPVNKTEAATIMLKRIFLGLVIAAGLLSPAYSAGTLPGFSLSQQMDKFGKPLAGCTLYIIQAGTTSTPQIAYQDSALTIPVPGGSQLTCDAAGRLPQFFLADGSIKIRLADVNGVQQVAADGLLVVGPSGGGGGGASVDPTTILTTGDIKVSYGVGVVSGFVRTNGRTIGNATSGATERANADTSALFAFLWNGDANLVVSSGRGVSAAVDYAANKTIALPDLRGRTIAGLDDMGNTAAGRLTSSYFGSAATTLGVSGGAESQTLTLAQLPTGITSGGSLGLSVGNLVSSNNNTTTFSANSGAAIWQAFPNGSSTGLNNPTTTGTLTSNNTNGTAHPVVQPTMLTTIYIKL
jgi:hypothetical protein